MAQPKEFWVVSVPQDAGPGASLRLLDVQPSEDEAKKSAGELPSDVTGRVAVLSRVVMFDRQLAVTATETEATVKGTKG